MQTEFEFTLPTGYLDDRGNVHQCGLMRRSRAMDEILPMQDPRVQANPAYATVIILSRVVVHLGDITEVTPQVIEHMFASDLSYLQTLYRQINSPELPETPEAAGGLDRGSPTQTETPTEEFAPV